MNIGSRHIFPTTVFLLRVFTVAPHIDRFTNYFFPRSETEVNLDLFCAMQFLYDRPTTRPDTKRNRETEKRNAYGFFCGKASTKDTNRKI
jgi:hypothetical protein